MNIPEFNIFRKPYNSRFLIEEKMAAILSDSYYFPSNMNINGAFFIDNYHFAANIKILGQRLGIYANSLNKDFRHHKIIYIQKLPVDKSSNLFDPKGWKIYHHSNQFFSLENVLKGDDNLTTKWDKNARKYPCSKNVQTEKIIDNQKNISQINTNQIEKPRKVLIKAQNQKSGGNNVHYLDDDENYLYFLS